MYHRKIQGRSTTLIFDLLTFLCLIHFTSHSCPSSFYHFIWEDGVTLPLPIL